MKEWKAGGKQHKDPFLLKSIYNGWNREKQCIHSTPEQAHTYRSVLFRTLQIWHISKSQWETSEVENVMLHAPYHLAYMVECVPVMVPWSSIIQGGWFSVSAGIQFRFKVCRPFTAFRTTLTGGTRAQSTGSHFAPTTHVIKSLSALPSVGVSVSCRHAVSHFRPAMMIFWARLTPVIIRLPAVYPLTPLRSKISLCSVSIREAKKVVLRDAGSRSRSIRQLWF